MNEKEVLLKDLLISFPDKALATGPKLNVRKTFRRSYEHLLNVLLYSFNVLRPEGRHLNFYIRVALKSNTNDNSPLE